jgi:branched-chain amino acid transport system substrate-binding protein
LIHGGESVIIASRRHVDLAKNADRLSLREGIAKSARAEDVRMASSGVDSAALRSLGQAGQSERTRRRSVRKLIVAGATLVAALAFTVSGALGSAAETGITSKSVKIGGTFALTGPASAYAPIPAGMKAYYAYINSRKGPDGKRGVYGRRIQFVYYDDGYNPANTVQLTRKLVEDDKVFAIVGQLGTEPCLSVREYLNQRKVPQVLVSTGATEFGSEWKEFPWTIGWQPDYIAEGRLYGLHIKANHAGKKIALLYQNDAYGKDYVYGVRSALGANYAKTNVVAEEGFEVTAPDVRSQMARIRASGAKVFLILGTPKFTVQAYAFGKGLGFNPDQIYVNSVGATAAFLNLAVGAAGAAYVNGSITTAYLKDPLSPRWQNDAAMKQYRALMAKYAPTAKADDILNVYGFASAETFVQALYKAGKNPTRASLMKALLSLNFKNKFALPGVTVRTTKTDHFPLSQMELQRFNNGVWSKIGPLVQARPR